MVLPTAGPVSPQLALPHPTPPHLPHQPTCASSTSMGRPSLVEVKWCVKWVKPWIKSSPLPSACMQGGARGCSGAVGSWEALDQVTIVPAICRGGGQCGTRAWGGQWGARAWPWGAGQGQVGGMQAYARHPTLGNPPGPASPGGGAAAGAAGPLAAHPLHPPTCQQGGTHLHPPTCQRDFEGTPPTPTCQQGAVVEGPLAPLVGSSIQEGLLHVDRLPACEGGESRFGRS